MSSFNICLNCAFVICLWCWHCGSLTAFSWRVVSGLHLGGDAGQPTTLPWQALYPSHVNCFRHKCAHAHTHMHVCTHTCTHTHAHAHTHARAHTHTHTLSVGLLEEMLFQKCYSLYKQCLVWMTSEGEEKEKQWLAKEHKDSFMNHKTNLIFLKSTAAVFDDITAKGECSRQLLQQLFQEESWQNAPYFSWFEASKCTRSNAMRYPI